MINLREDVVNELIDRGISAEIETIDKLVNNLENSLNDCGYWDLVKETIDNSGIKKEETIVEVGKEYVIRNLDFIKASLRNKKVRVKKIDEDKSVFVEVLAGRFNGSIIHLESKDFLKTI